MAVFYVILAIVFLLGSWGVFTTAPSAIQEILGALIGGSALLSFGLATLHVRLYRLDDRLARIEKLLAAAPAETARELVEGLEQSAARRAAARNAHE